MMNKYRVFYKLKLNKYSMDSTCEIVDAQDENTARAIINDKYANMSVEIQAIIKITI